MDFLFSYDEPAPKTAMEAFAQNMALLLRAIAAKVMPQALARLAPALTSGRIPRREWLLPHVVVLFHGWVTRVVRAFTDAVASPVPLPAPAPREPAAGAAVSAADRVSRKERLCLPRRFGWLVHHVGYVAAGCASQLRVLLGEPEMQAILRANPGAAHKLRGLCHALGIEKSLLTPPLPEPEPEPEPDEATAQPPELQPEPPPKPSAEASADAPYTGLLRPGIDYPLVPFHPPPKTTG